MCAPHHLHLGLYFNPRSPRRERHILSKAQYDGILFQSTLPAEGATAQDRAWICVLRFQSTLPAEGATVDNCQKNSKEIFQSTLPAEGATLMMVLTLLKQ